MKYKQKTKLENNDDLKKEGFLKDWKKSKKVKLFSGLGVILIAIVMLLVFILSGKENKINKQEVGIMDPELARAMTYEEVKEGDEIVEGAENVRFDAFFLRDLNGDGYAESIRGTCKEIGSETGVYVAEDGSETPIEKVIDFNLDWYGEAKARISTTTQEKDLEDAIDKENGKMVIDFTIYTDETNKELILYKNHVEGEIPLLSGYAPTNVEYLENTGVFNYNDETLRFTIDKEASVDGVGNVTTISRSNSYDIRVEYEIEVRNEGEIAGKVTILEKIPEYLSMKKADNPGWEITGNEARYETEEIGVGESKTYKVVMEWKKGDGHFGMQTNIAKIEEVSTPSGFEEENLQNNADEAEVMITISTGVEKVSGIVLIALIYIAAVIYMNRRFTIRKDDKE